MKGGKILHKMSQKIISVSISQKQFEYITEMNIKPSKILQAGIEEMMANSEINSTFVKEQQRKLEFLQNTLDKQRDFIQNKGLMVEFCENV